MQRGELAAGDGRLGAGSTTHLRMCHFTFSGLGNSALLAAGERPETVNINSSLLGANLFRQNGLIKGATTSFEIRSTFPESSDPQMKQGSL